MMQISRLTIEPDYSREGRLIGRVSLTDAVGAAGLAANKLIVELTADDMREIQAVAERVALAAAKRMLNPTALLA